MITSNSRAVRHIDTALHGGMTNLQDTEPGGLLTAADFARQRRPSLALRAWRATRRAVLLPWFRWQLKCIRDEREGYEAAGLPIGKHYRAECDRQERVLRGRIAFLECDL